jgi:putative FmdB family regulatory protein
VPLYEYQCRKHGRFEVIQKFSDPVLKACPKCGGKVEKLLSAPAIQFKGTGWYVTDYAKKSGGDEKSAAKDEKSASKNGDKKADSGSASKSKDSSASTDASSSTPTSKSKDSSASKGSSPT